MRLASAVAAAMLLFTMAAQAADAPAVIGMARQHVEATDARATGHLVRVDANGTRTSNAFSIKAHWFPGVLRVLLEIVPSQKPAAEDAPKASRQGAHREARTAILLEMRPSGGSTIRVFGPHESAPVSLPFSKWNEGVLDTDFNYEDFLQPEYYWQSQTFLKSTKLGARDCDVLKSAPGASEHSHYAEVQTWFDHTIGYPLYVEKTLKDAATVKEFTSFGLRQTDGVWSARQVEVKIHGRPGSTLLIFDRGSTKANLTLKDFSPEQISQSADHP